MYPRVLVWGEPHRTVFGRDSRCGPQDNLAWQGSCGIVVGAPRSCLGVTALSRTAALDSEARNFPDVLNLNLGRRFEAEKTYTDIAAYLGGVAVLTSYVLTVAI